MKEKILGDRYKFSIELDEGDKNFPFQILSLYKRKGQKSTITNLNFIISELIYPTINTTDVDTTIFLNKLEGIKLFRKSISIFRNKSWIKILENAMDEDRNIGGWNSNFRI